MTERDLRRDIPGAEAETPTQIPPRGWRDIAVRGWREAGVDQVPLLSAGVAFFGFLAIFPALIAVTLSYGLVTDPATVSEQMAAISGSLPADAQRLLHDQLTQLAAAPAQGLGWGVAVSIAVALWSASGGMGNLVTAINIAYDEERRRGFVREKLIALGLTVAAVVFLLLVMTLVAGLPVVMDALGVGGGWRWVADVARWVLLSVVVMAGLAVLYRVAPARADPKLRWVSVGAVIATVLWLVASAAFSLYVTWFGNYAKTYGAVAGAAVLMLWLWITCYAVLLGAEINAEAEQQTAADTTTGPPQPMGSRGAVKADSLPGDAVPHGREEPG